jgi:hypothetical protein
MSNQTQRGIVAFPATAVPSADVNTLDDYEEGTWEAAFVSGVGTITIDPSKKTGYYTKIGREVFIQGEFYISSVSSNTGDVNITGLPFTSIGESAAFTINMDNLASAIAGYIGAYITSGTTVLNIREFGTIGYGNDLSDHIDSGTRVFISGKYLAA